MWGGRCIERPNEGLGSEQSLFIVIFRQKFPSQLSHGTTDYFLRDRASYIYIMMVMQVVKVSSCLLRWLSVRSQLLGTVKPSSRQCLILSNWSSCQVP